MNARFQILFMVRFQFENLSSMKKPRYGHSGWAQLWVCKLYCMSYPSLTEIYKGLTLLSHGTGTEQES